MIRKYTDDLAGRRARTKAGRSRTTTGGGGGSGVLVGSLGAIRRAGLGGHGRHAEEPVR